MVKKFIFQKSLTSNETNLTLLVLSFYWHDPEPKRNHKIASSRAKTRSRQSHTRVKYFTHKKKHGNKVDFPGVIFNFSKLSFGLLQSNAWLESYDHYCLFGTMIWGALIVSPVLWFLSSRNTLLYSHSDTAVAQKMTDSLKKTNTIFHVGLTQQESENLKIQNYEAVGWTASFILDLSKITMFSSS